MGGSNRPVSCSQGGLAAGAVADASRARLHTLVATMTREGLSGSTVRNETALLKHAGPCRLHRASAKRQHSGIGDVCGEAAEHGNYIAMQ